MNYIPAILDLAENHDYSVNLLRENTGNFSLIEVWISGFRAQRF